MLSYTTTNMGGRAFAIQYLVFVGKVPWLTHPAKIDQQDLNSTHIDEFRVPYFPYPLWRDKAMHELVMHVALSAADAIAKSGRPIRMAQRVMLRVDIALTVQGRMAKPYINEAHVFNDAGLSFDVWPPHRSNEQDRPATNSTGEYSAKEDLAAQSSTEMQQCDIGEDSSRNAQSVSRCLNQNKVDECVCKFDGNVTAQAAMKDQEATVMGRGFLLAAKLWQEMLLTLDAATQPVDH